MATRRSTEERSKHIFYFLVGLAFIIIGASSIVRTMITNQIQLQLIKNGDITSSISIDRSALMYTLPITIFADAMLIIIGLILIFLERFIDWIVKE